MFRNKEVLNFSIVIQLCLLSSRIKQNERTEDSHILILTKLKFQIDGIFFRLRKNKNYNPSGLK